MSEFIRNIVLWKLIPFVLLMVWLMLSFLSLSQGLGFTVITHNHNKSNVITAKTTELLKGEKLRAQFNASYDYLGIVSVRFNTFRRINNDKVLFRIRRKGEREWYYQNLYKVDQFQNNQLFTFGFLVIPNSRGINYEFEIVSTDGKPKNAVALSSTEPIFVTKYQYSAADLKNNRGKLILFLYGKAVNALTNIEFVVTLFIYLLPLICYLLWIMYMYKYSLVFYNNLSRKSFVAFTPFIIVGIESLILNNRNGLVVIILTSLLFVTTVVYKFTSRVTFCFAFLFLLICPLLLQFSMKLPAENYAFWAYILLWIGVIQMLWELKKGDKGKVDIPAFFQKSFQEIKQLLFFVRK